MARSGSSAAGVRITTRRHPPASRITENSRDFRYCSVPRPSPVTEVNFARRTRVGLGGHWRVRRTRALVVVAAVTAVTFTAGCAGLGSGAAAGPRPATATAGAGSPGPTAAPAAGPAPRPAAGGAAYSGAAPPGA